jgi:hypothetical protein
LTDLALVCGRGPRRTVGSPELASKGISTSCKSTIAMQPSHTWCRATSGQDNPTDKH